MATNIATKFLNMLNTKSLFSNIDKRHKKEIGCNMLLFKFLTQDDQEFYAINEFDKYNNQTVIRIPSDEEVQYLMSMILLDGTKICKYDIGNEYLKECLDYCDISFFLFSKSVDARTRTNEALINLCGLLFLDLIRRKNSTKDIYVKLVCSESRSSSENVGLGSKFMLLTENIGKLLKCDKVLLSSVDKPLGFYLSKNYKPVSGKSLYEIPEDIKIPIFKRGKVLQSSLPKKALFLNSMGMTTSFNNATRLLPQNNNLNNRRRTTRETAGKKFLGDGTIGALSGVKLDIDPTSEMVVMEKSLFDNKPIVAQGKPRKQQKRQSKRGKPKKKRTYKRKKTKRK